MKSRLRHPIRAVREPFGTAGLIVAMIALIAALGGSALAAKGALSGKQKKEVEKIAKKFAGKPGAPGANGAAGPQGPAGPAGPAGAAGTAGKDGSPGEPGKQGKEGKEGREGSPWTAGGTLPEGATETGVWNAEEAGEVGIISFAIPLAAGQEPKFTSGCEANPVAASCQVHYVNSTGKEVNGQEQEVSPLPQCPGNAVEPKAAPGNLCVYSSSPGVGSNDAFFQSPATGSAGTATAGATLLAMEAMRGTWAVTAPEAP